jgi:hypothetical protein
MHSSESSLYLFTGQTLTGFGDYRRLIPQTLLNQRVQAPFVDFHGDFLRITLAPGAAGTSSIADLATAAFNDKATSLMLVDRWKNGANETTVSAANTFTAGWDLAFLAVIPAAQLLLGGGVAISRVQDPVFSWLAFPPPNQMLPTNYTYMVASQWFVFNAWGIGVNAWLMFYFRLGRDGNGKVELNVVDMDYYVWSGTGQGQMQTALSGAKNGIMSALQAVSSLVLGNVTGTVRRRLSPPWYATGRESDNERFGAGQCSERCHDRSREPDVTEAAPTASFLPLSRGSFARWK